MPGWVDKLDFDSTDADTLATSSRVGSILIDSSDNELTNTVVGADRGLDVNVINDIGIDLDGIYNVSTNADPDNVGMIAHSRAASPGDAEQGFRSTGGTANADDVVAANVHGLDVNAFGMVFDGSTWDRQLGTAGAAHVYLDGADTDFAVNVNLQDGSGNDIDSLDGNLNVAEVGVTVANGSTTVDTSGTGEVDVVASALSNRGWLFLKNFDNKFMYIGATGVTPANGFPLAQNSAIELKAGSALPLKAVGAADGLDMRYLEIGY